MTKILIADDEENIRLLLEQVVKGLGYDAVLAHDGQEAFQMANTELPDLVLLDIMMPGWNGVDAVKSLDFIEKRPKVMVISGYISDELRDDLKNQSNVVGYITKPFSLSDIREKIKAQIDGDAGGEV